MLFFPSWHSELSLFSVAKLEIICFTAITNGHRWGEGGVLRALGRAWAKALWRGWARDARGNVSWDEAGAAGVASWPGWPPETLHKQSCWGDVSRRKCRWCLPSGFLHMAGKCLPWAQNGGVRLALPKLPLVYVVFCFFWAPHLQSPDVGCFQTRWLALLGFCRRDAAQRCREL